MSAVLLLILACVVAALAALGLCAAVLPRRIALLHAVAAGLCGAGAAITLAGTPGASVALPVGLPGMAIHLALDPLSRPFLVLVFGASAAALTAATDVHGPEDVRAAPFLPVFVACMAFALLAADAFGLLLGFEAMSVASWALVLARHADAEARDAAALYLGMAAFSAACLVIAVAMLAMPSPDLTFASMRQHPPDGAWAAGVLGLATLGAGAKAGLFPLHVWLPRAHPVAPAPASALMSGAMTKVALYVLARILFDLCGDATPVWWGVPLVVLGAASATIGVLRAVLEDDLKAALACSTVENVGLIAIGFGLALAARGADLAPLAALALGAALLHVLAHGTFKTLLFLGAGAADHAAGTRLLSRLGGLVHHMPVTTGCMIAGCAALAALPPSSGFASEWMLLQSALAAPRIGGLALQTLFACAAALIALAAALAATACVRIIGVGFLGRPRVPRTAGAQEPALPVRAALIALSVLTAFIGLFPGLVLRLIDPALRHLVGGGIAATSLFIATSHDSPGYAPLAIGVLLAAGAALPLLVLRRRRMQERDAPAWACGFAASPPWLPFGDPATQYGAASFAQPVRRTLGTLMLATEQSTPADPGSPVPARLVAGFTDPAEPLLFVPVGRVRLRLSSAFDRLQFLTVRRTLSLMFAVPLLFLTAIAVLEAL
ncbi:MAG TPA: proton-conducting transporter membrane subunit [Acidisphaera sp.]|nr:proton-conducting transporter membrane subunit [Acidisphaera sp.]